MKKKIFFHALCVPEFVFLYQTSVISHRAELGLEGNGQMVAVSQILLQYSCADNKQAEWRREQKDILARLCFYCNEGLEFSYIILQGCIDYKSGCAE